jgi:dolichol-phosphate mannosyltransferase
VARLYEALRSAGVGFDSLCFVHDLDDDTALPFVERLRAADPRVGAERNSYGPGVLQALRFAFDRCRRGPVIVLMGDLSDKLSIVPRMLELWRSGATLVAPSRYMRGGRQHGGGLVKSNASRLAGRSLRLLGFPCSDPTNNFKLYDGDWLRRQEIESRGGFEVALELCYKAFVQGEPIAELPTEWFDRAEGKSRFRFWRWLPHYLRWYLRSLAAVARRRGGGALR